MSGITRVISVGVLTSLCLCGIGSAGAYAAAPAQDAPPPNAVQTRVGNPEATATSVTLDSVSPIPGVTELNNQMAANVTLTGDYGDKTLTAFTRVSGTSQWVVSATAVTEPGYPKYVIPIQYSTSGNIDTYVTLGSSTQSVKSNVVTTSVTPVSYSSGGVPLLRFTQSYEKGGSRYMRFQGVAAKPGGPSAKHTDPVASGTKMSLWVSDPAETVPSNYKRIGEITAGTGGNVTGTVALPALHDTDSPYQESLFITVGTSKPQWDPTNPPPAGRANVSAVMPFWRDVAYTKQAGELELNPVTVWTDPDTGNRYVQVSGYAPGHPDWMWNTAWITDSTGQQVGKSSDAAIDDNTGEFIHGKYWFPVPTLAGGTFTVHSRTADETVTQNITIPAVPAPTQKLNPITIWTDPDTGNRYFQVSGVASGYPVGTYDRAWVIDNATGQRVGPNDSTVHLSTNDTFAHGKYWFPVPNAGGNYTVYSEIGSGAMYTQTSQQVTVAPPSTSIDAPATYQMTTPSGGGPGYVISGDAVGYPAGTPVTVTAGAATLSTVTAADGHWSVLVPGDSNRAGSVIETATVDPGQPDASVARTVTWWRLPVGQTDARTGHPAN